MTGPPLRRRVQGARCRQPKWGWRSRVTQQLPLRVGSVRPKIWEWQVRNKIMKKKRIVVTGMGLVSCFGTDVDHFYNQLLAGHSGITPIDGFPCQDYPTRFAGVVRNFDCGDYLDKNKRAGSIPSSATRSSPVKKLLR